MPSAEHEGLVTLFEQHPALAAELLALADEAQAPDFAEARLESSNLSQLDPAAFHADAVVVLRDRKGKANLALVVEVQRRVHARKRFTWMLYVASVAARFGCPADLLVLTLDPSVSRWARRPLTAVRRMPWSPVVVGPEEIPLVTEVEEARRSPERALLSLMAHRPTADLPTVVRLGYATAHALEVLEEGVQDLYSRMMERALQADGARALEAYMDAQGEKLGYFTRKVEAARRTALEEGRQEGRLEGRQEGRQEGRLEAHRQNLSNLLELRFGSLSDAQRVRIGRMGFEEAERLFTVAATAESLSEVLD